MFGRTPRRILVGLALITPFAGGCAGSSDNEAVFAAGGGTPDPNVPQDSAEYDLKYQNTPAPASKKGR